ncbi:tektin-1 [Parambassis ranga]|uniref:Tektin n=1 Tax=Parambassis ranga TaxID=210632 RepID=A0A6P7JK80_9TELE|nr:tektin-1-like [Parambassis ranga]
MSAQDRSHQRDVEPSLVSAEVGLRRSQLFRSECQRLIEEMDKACKHMQNDNNKRLDQRVTDITFQKKELEMKLGEVILDIDMLIALQSRVEKAIEAYKEPLRVTLLCLEERMKRPPSERVLDEVDRELQKEKEGMEGVMSLLQRVLEQITEQIRLNRSSKYHLEEDLTEKFEAKCIDDSCALMTTHSITDNLQESKKRNPALSNLIVTHDQWKNISDINITKAEQQMTSSLSLRTLVESVLEQTAADMQKQFQATRAAFQLNIQEIKSAKSQMEDKMSQVQSEIANQQRTREDLHVAITENEEFLTLAEARLGLRGQRPGKEQCYDTAQSHLLTDVQRLRAHISKLRKEVAQSQKQQRVLLECQRNLQENIDTKATSLYIDEVICTQHREPIVIHNF